MNHTENDYIQAGYRYEKAKGADQARARAEILRQMIESERVEDRAYARHLIERGRSEAR